MAKKKSAEAVKQHKSDYYQKWYEKNREKVQAQRAEKYRTDATYRNSALERSRQWWRAKSRKERVRHKEESVETESRNVCGKLMDVLSSGSFAKAIGYSHATVYEWRSGGVLPPPTLRDENGAYWYSWDYTSMVDNVLQEMSQEPWNLQIFREKLWGVFRKSLARRKEYAGRRFEGTREVFADEVVNG